MMFETIKEFEDYIFSIETEEQLKDAKYGKADCVNYFQSLSPDVQMQALKDILTRNDWGAFNQDYVNYLFSQYIEENHKDGDHLEDMFAAMEKIALPKILNEYYGKFPLRNAILNSESVMQLMIIGGNDSLNEILNVGNYVIPEQNINRELEKLPLPENLKNELYSLYEGGFGNATQRMLNAGLMKLKEEGIDDGLAELFGLSQELEEVGNQNKNENKNCELLDESTRELITQSEWFKKAMDEGFIELLNGEYKWKGTKKTLSLFADYLSEKLHLKYKWHPFEILFKQKYLAQTMDKVNGNFGSGKFGEREKAIRQIFAVK